MISIQDASYAIGITFIVVTIMIAVFKNEVDLPIKEIPPSIVETYKISYRILFLGLDLSNRY